MRHFVAYHNAEKMGHVYDGAHGYAFFSSKALGFLDKTLGEVIWAINGSRSTSRTTLYSVCAVYTPEEVLEVDDPQFKFIVSGNVGHDFDPPITLNSMSWFADFLKSQSNFSLGISEVKNAAHIDALVALAKDVDIGDLVARVNYKPPSDIDLSDIVAAEGAESYATHLRRERNRAVVEAKRRHVLAKYGRLVCEVCNFDFSSFYGAFGEGYCEVHHKVPLANLTGHRITKLEDLAIVCSNCHRVIHHNRPMPTVSELYAYVNREKA